MDYFYNQSGFDKACSSAPKQTNRKVTRQLEVMGHGVVSRPLGGSIMRELGEEYEKLSKLGHGNLVVQEKLEAKYRSFIEMVSSSTLSSR